MKPLNPRKMKSSQEFVTLKLPKYSQNADVLDYDIAVLIPCYNEEVTIQDVILGFTKSLPSARIYVYDNNSTDNTVKKAYMLGAIVRQETAQGKGNVVRRMFRDIDADLYVIVDGDSTYEASAASALVKLAIQGHFDMVNGTRIYQGTERKGHKFGNVILTGLVKFMFGNQVHDLLSGYKVLSRRFVKSFPTVSSGFEIETELAVHALELKMPITNAETRYYGRPEGSKSKLQTFRDGRLILITIMRLFVSYRPLQLFGIFSLILCLLGLLSSIPVIYTFYQTGVLSHFYFTLATVVLITLSIFVYLVGLILHFSAKTRREQRMLQYLGIPWKKEG